MDQVPSPCIQVLALVLAQQLSVVVIKIANLRTLQVPPRVIQIMPFLND
jgi:hypothetical protein